MSPDGSKRGSPDEWMAHAISDLRLARLAAGDALVQREQACFHAQQAAEKAIKAVLLFKKTAFPLTHDIETLLEIAEKIGIPLSDKLQEASLLTPYAVETRYPGTWADVTEEDLNEAIRVAETTVTWANEICNMSPRNETPNNLQESDS